MPHYKNTNPSILERKAALLLDQGDILYVTEFSFPDLKSDRGISLRFDFAIFSTPEDLEKEHPAFLLETQGEQHYKQKFQSTESFRRQIANDKRKVAYCAAKGINLVVIPWTEYNQMTLDLILEEGRFFE
jgi:hypothetical protein